MGDDLKNPYAGEGEPEEIRVGGTVAWFLVVLFLMVLAVPPVVRNFRDARAGERTVIGRLVEREEGVGVVEHLRAVESHVEAAFFTDVPRRAVQRFLAAVLGEGNRKTLVGEDGWLYLRSSVEALTATGPLVRGPVGAASDPALRRWRGPIEAIRVFARELRERGIELVLVPVPVKAMLKPEGLVAGASKRPVAHEDTVAFYREVETMGVKVLDLVPPLSSHKGEGELFLKQDTHWRPEAMEVAAAEVASYLKGRDWWEAGGVRKEFESESVEAKAIGDLVEQLDLGDSAGLFASEPVTVRKVVDAATGERPRSERMARISVVGDSFVNVFDDPSLGFGDGSGEPIGAGFGQHLAMALGEAVHVAALNGQGATGARGVFARLYDNEVRAKRVVVWMIASRDLMYTPALAMRNSVEWGDVAWNPESVRDGGGERDDEAGEVVEAVLVEKAKLTDPKLVNYAHSLFETAWDVLEVEGAGTAKEGVRVFFWGFRDKLPTEESRMKVGERYRFRIYPEDAIAGVAGANRDPLPEEDFSESYFGELLESP